jgi:hypothetical protein
LKTVFQAGRQFHGPVRIPEQWSWTMDSSYAKPNCGSVVQRGPLIGWVVDRDGVMHDPRPAAANSPPPPAPAAHQQRPHMHSTRSGSPRKTPGLPQASWPRPFARGHAGDSPARRVPAHRAQRGVLQDLGVSENVEAGIAGHGSVWRELRDGRGNARRALRSSALVPLGRLDVANDGRRLRETGRSGVRHGERLCRARNVRVSTAIIVAVLGFFW